jgi:hypothetical protein
MLARAIKGTVTHQQLKAWRKAMRLAHQPKPQRQAA